MLQTHNTHTDTHTQPLTKYYEFDLFPWDTIWSLKCTRTSGHTLPRTHSGRGGMVKGSRERKDGGRKKEGKRGDRGGRREEGGERM